MIKTIFFLSFFFLYSLTLYGQDVKTVGVIEKDIEVIMGIDHIEKYDFNASTNVQVGNSSVLRHVLIPQKRQISLKGLKAGQTSVIIRDVAGDIKAKFMVRVTVNDLSKLVQELKSFIGDVEGLEIGIKGDSIYVGGKIVVPSDIGKVVVILNNEKFKEVIRLVELSPHTQRVIAQKMQEEIQANGMKNVRTRIVNKLFWLEGFVSSNAMKTRAYNIAAAYLPENIMSLAQQEQAVEAVKKDILQNFISVNKKRKPAPIPKLIKITAQFVELSKDYNKIFGFKWAPLMSGSGGEIQIGRGSGGGLTTKSGGSTLTATISNLFPKLSSAKNAGHARIIQSGILVVKNKVEGKISKESSRPFALGTGDFTKSETAVSGFSLGVTPSILADEKIDLKIGVSVSSNIGDPPETLSNNISTEMVVKSKESAVVGGIVINKTSTGFDRNPPYGIDEYENGTPLFNFLRSKSYLSNKSQFVVFITPEIIESASTGTEDIKRKFRKRRR
ncbi:MAG: pilus assembly protein N-terminal domain-containing protein [Bacteriovoracaceae bacterium]|nr:pilus assembly protein N-terminal domain-containing protein [Bacteriovoracaceae bacterium]